MSAMMPVLYPAGVQEYPRSRPARLGDVALLGLLGRVQVRLRRTSSARPRSSVDPARSMSSCPNDFDAAAGRAQHPLARQLLDQEARLHDHKVYAALAFARANRLEPHRHRQPAAAARHHHHAANPISTCARRSSTSASTTRLPREIGIRVYKVGMMWPLEPRGRCARSRTGSEEILVVEEKRAIIENQLKEQLYNWHEKCAAARRRQVRRGMGGPRRMAAAGRAASSRPAIVAQAIAPAPRAASTTAPTHRRARLAFLEAKERRSPSRRSRDLVRVALFLLRLPAQQLDAACPRAATRSPASAATSWRSSWTATPRPSRQWAAKARRGSAMRRSPTRSTSSPTSATAPTTTRACSRSAPRSPPRSTSPSRSSTTTRSR